MAIFPVRRVVAICVLICLCRIEANHVKCNNRYFRHGDFILGGLFDNSNGDCHSGGDSQVNKGSTTVHRMEAMVYALKEVNKRNDILPNITLGFDIYDTCAEKTVAVARALNQLINKKDCQYTEANFCQMEVTHENYAPIIGVIGAEWSSITTSVSPIYSTFHLPSLSFSSSSDELSDSKNFPYFLRVIPPDRYQVKAIIDLLQHFNWTSVSFVYTDDSYGRNALKLFKDLTNTRNDNNHVCIAEQFGVNSDSDYDYIVRSIMNHDNSRVVILFTHSVYARRFLQSMADTDAVGKLQLVGSDGWGTLQNLKNYSHAASGALKISFVAEPVFEFERYFQQESPFNENPWFDKNLTSERGFSKTSAISRVLDSVLVYAYGLEAMLKKECPRRDALCLHNVINNFNGTKLLHSMKSLNFRGYCRNNVCFDSNGDGKGTYDLTNLQCRSDNIHECELVPVGNWSSIHRLNINETLMVWGVKSTGTELSSVPDSYCEGPPTYTQWSDTHAIIIVILNSLGLLCTIIVAICYAKNIKHDLIRASGPGISYLVLIGVFMSYLLVFAFITKPTTATCYFIRIGYMLCFTTISAPLLVHANTIFRRYRAVRRCTRRPGYTSPSSKMFFSFCLIVIQICIIMVFLIITPPQTVILEPIARQRELTCNKNKTELAISLSYNIILVILCSIHAFLTRKVPENFSESRFIGFSAYTTLVIWLIFIPSYINAPFTNWKVMILSFAMIISASVTLIFLFVVKLYAVYSGSALNISQPDLQPPRPTEKSWPSEGARSGVRQERIRPRAYVISTRANNPSGRRHSVGAATASRPGPVEISINTRPHSINEAVVYPPHALTSEDNPFRSFVSTWL